jgi:hypothetical protein
VTTDFCKDQRSIGAQTGFLQTACSRRGIEGCLLSGAERAGKPSFNWSKIDQLYYALTLAASALSSRSARGLEPQCERWLVNIYQMDQKYISMNRFAGVFFVLFLSPIALSIGECGGGSQGGGGTTSQNPTPPTVTVTPASSSISTAQSLSVTIAV